MAMQNGDVLKIIEKAKDLPTLSTVATRVLSVTSGAETSVKEVAELIEKDVALSVKVLQVINSPFYGFGRGITSVSEAVGLMGFEQVGDLALGISVMGSFFQDDTFGFSFRHFWERCVGNAVAAVKLTALVKPDASHSIFTAALLQDIGTCLLVQNMPLAYGMALGVAKERNSHIVEAEREILGADHTEVGAILADKWSLPISLQISIRYHHFAEFGDDPGEEVANHHLSTEVKVINVSNLMTKAFYEEEDVEGVRTALTDRAEDLLKLKPDQVEAILDQLPLEIEQARSLFLPTSMEEVPPVVEKDVPDEEEARRAIRKQDKSKHKILVAEDSAATRIAISNMLKRMGYEVIIAFNGEEAVKLARREKPDLIMLDVLMPVMDGIDALREIRADTQLRTTPVVMLTSMTDIRMVTEAIEAGANDYIAKPFQVSLLIERVERYIHAR